MKQLTSIFLRVTFCLMSITSFLMAQNNIAIVYQGRQELSKAGQDLMNAQGFPLPKMVSSYTLVIENGSSQLTLDSLMFQNTDDNFKKYLIWDRISKFYNNKKFNYQKGVFVDGRCYGGFVNYVSEVKIFKERSKSILGLKCYYAEYSVDNHEYEVWYTEDIPYTDGPFRLNEFNRVNVPLLPGVVLEMQESPDGSFFKAEDIYVGKIKNSSDYSIECNEYLPIVSYDKLSYRNMLEQHAFKLSGADIIVGKWYSAMKK